MGSVTGGMRHGATDSFVAGRLCGLILCLLFALGCRSGELHRPAGVMRVGKVREFVGRSETFLPELRLLVRSDERGVSVMSTECTHDLSPLELVEEEGRRILLSRYSGSRYTISGAVISGPQKTPLPFFVARIGAETWDGPLDTLYIEMGRSKEVGGDWRLPITSNGTIHPNNLQQPSPTP